jgi:hypothetical protein
MPQGATRFFERPVTTGGPEAFVHGVRPSSVSNLSAQPPRFAMRSLVWPSQPRLLSWGDVVRRMVLEGTVWGPHSLHTAEVVGSNPTTPTRASALPEFLGVAALQEVVSGPPAVLAVAAWTLAGWGMSSIDRLHDTAASSTVVSSAAPMRLSTSRWPCWRR